MAVWAGRGAGAIQLKIGRAMASDAAQSKSRPDEGMPRGKVHAIFVTPLAAT